HNVLNSDVDETTLYTVSTEGIMIFDISTPVPFLIESGGRGGHTIAAEGPLVATSNGSSINLHLMPGLQTPVNEEPVLIPLTARLHQNYPNPFNPATTITYSLKEQSDVSLSVFNLLGRQVISLAEGSHPAGEYRVEWNGSDQNGTRVASGIYFYRLTTDRTILTRKMTLLK
ncbi:MAG: T9SS type A sorting domain-containing protein, partial [candidate division Zixibacteria bacterium]